MPRAPPASVLAPQLVLSSAASNYSSCCCPPDCPCIWTDWIDVSYPNSSDRNGGDYETFENIRKYNSTWDCVKADSILCRAEKFPGFSIADLGQKVDCNVNTGLICNNKDQQLGGVVPMPVCLNYKIRVCCIPNIPECIGSSTTSITTTSPGSPTSTVTSPPTSTAGPTLTPSQPSTTTMPPSSTTSSTPGTTTSGPGPSTPTSTTA
ncbi:MUC5A protein, partial [Podilymbus podiceps]|nr:MUC5A protein [Podilymbus podiceps]